ncbi:MAG: class I SAM-dependent methyltransferase [Clostridiaceae bacterium]|nr:class I SAM-dependent methyltransferase [Clostridiaceae bacterium]
MSYKNCFLHHESQAHDARTIDGTDIQIDRLLQLSALSFHPLKGKERDDTILAALKRIQQDTQIVGTEERTQVWQDGWNEILQRFIESGCRLDSLQPQYYREHTPIRLHKDFVVSDNPRFEYELQQFIKESVFQQYLSDVSNIYEFGCGTGYNLVMLARMFPEKQLYGLDFVPSAIEILRLLSEKHGLPISGKLFNIKQPDMDYTLAPGSGICTFVCLEQVSDQFEAFLQYLLVQKPAICVHLEPIVELYDDNNLIDWMAKQFHNKRHYLSGFYPRLLELEQEKQLELLHVQRLEFGNMNHEGYTLVVWRPV